MQHQELASGKRFWILLEDGAGNMTVVQGGRYQGHALDLSVEPIDMGDIEGHGFRSFRPGPKSLRLDIVNIHPQDGFTVDQRVATPAKPGDA